MAFSFEKFVTDIRAAAGGPDANANVREELERCLADPEPIIAATPVDGDDEVMLFEDESVSIWWCRFQPHVVMPPHEHLLDVHIGAYAGGEKNIVFTQSGDRLVHDFTHVVKPGEVLSLDRDCIHAVTAEGDVRSLALHVYMGPLMQLTRGLFDWETGEKINFSMENFNQMKRPASALAAY